MKRLTMAYRGKSQPSLTYALPRVCGSENKTARIVWAVMARGETYRAGYRPALAT
jgi:hypothetical protein